MLHCHYYYFMDGQREYCHGETEALINWSAALSLPMLVRIDFMSLKIGLCGTTLLLFSTLVLLWLLLASPFRSHLYQLYLVLDGAQILIRFKILLQTFELMTNHTT